MTFSRTDLVAALRDELSNIQNCSTKIFEACSNPEEMLIARRRLIGRGGRLSIVLRKFRRVRGNDRKMLGERANVTKEAVEKTYSAFVNSKNAIGWVTSEVRVVEDSPSYDPFAGTERPAVLVDRAYELAYMNVRKRWATAELELMRAVRSMSGHLSDPEVRRFVCAYNDRTKGVRLKLGQTGTFSEVNDRFRRHEDARPGAAIAAVAAAQDPMDDSVEDFDSDLMAAYNESSGSLPMQSPSWSDAGDASSVQSFIDALQKSGGHPSAAILARQSSDQSSAIYDECKKIVFAHPEQAAAYRAGKTGLMGFFIGKVMRASGPGVEKNFDSVGEMLESILASQTVGKGLVVNKTVSGFGTSPVKTEDEPGVWKADPNGSKSASIGSIRAADAANRSKIFTTPAPSPRATTPRHSVLDVNRLRLSRSAP